MSHSARYNRCREPVRYRYTDQYSKKTDTPEHQSKDNLFSDLDIPNHTYSISNWGLRLNGQIVTSHARTPALTSAGLGSAQHHSDSDTERYGYADVASQTQSATARCPAVTRKDAGGSQLTATLVTHKKDTGMPT
ncbi:hypothetical protein J6590_003036 [Homalodisca vitripennis]|nr:hypothetical protein J6590_003036 [Homalodisca vitripennis]